MNTVVIETKPTTVESFADTRLKCVEARFEKWREEKPTDSGRIPSELWNEALDLYFETDLPIQVIVNACGFASGDYMARVIRKKVQNVIAEQGPIPRDPLEEAMYYRLKGVPSKRVMERSYPKWFRKLATDLYNTHDYNKSVICKTLGFSPKFLMKWVNNQDDFKDAQIPNWLKPKQLNVAPNPRPDLEPAALIETPPAAPHQTESAPVTVSHQILDQNQRVTGLTYELDNQITVSLKQLSENLTVGKLLKALETIA